MVFRVKEKEHFTDTESSNKATLQSPQGEGSSKDAKPGAEAAGVKISLPVLAHFINNNYLITEDKNIVSVKRNMKKYGMAKDKDFMLELLNREKVVLVAGSSFGMRSILTGTSRLASSPTRRW